MTWEVRQAPNDPNAWDVYDGEGKVAHLPWCSKANAHLIAAAPIMLIALQDLRDATIEVYQTGLISTEPFVRAGNVIAKAEGR